MFDETSMVKPTDSQQVDSDTTSPSLERSVLFEVIPSVTQRDDRVAEQDAIMMRIKDKL